MAILASGLALLSGCDRSQGSASNQIPEAPDGWEVYAENCLACHQADGKGLPKTIPPLAGSEWLSGQPDRLIALTLDGVRDAQDVEGVEYRGVMPACKNTLNDSQIAAVLTYIRQTWGNNSSTVTALEVRKVRRATNSHNTFWTSKDLLRAYDLQQ